MTSQTMEKRTRIGNTRKPQNYEHHMKAMETWKAHQRHKNVVGAPQDIKPIEEMRDWHMQQAMGLDEIVQAIKMKKPLLAPVTEPKKVETKPEKPKLVAVAPTNGQIQTMVAREVAKMKGEVLAAIQGLKK